MGKISNRLLVAALLVIAIAFGGRAVAILSALWSSPQNFLPARPGTGGYPTCPPQTYFTGETEQVITILASLMVLGIAWMIWQKSSRLP